MGSTSASLLVFALLALFHTGTCYQCYSCAGTDSDKQITIPFPGLTVTKGCADPVDTSKITAKADCSGDSNACIKIKTGEVYIRSCLPTQSCDAYDDCHSCQSELCNSSSNVVPSVIFVSIVSLAFAKLFL